MKQIARNLTMEEWGILKPGTYLMHDRDTKFCTRARATSSCFRPLRQSPILTRRSSAESALVDS
jgi:hypothetical protein